MAKYRFRTRLRRILPWRLIWLAPKGAQDCGSHEWYREGDDRWLCYHCVVGKHIGSDPAKFDS
jgi:hypothetical protein